MAKLTHCSLIIKFFKITLSFLEEGRPKLYTSKQINNAIEMLKKNSYTEVAEITGISKSTLIREVRKRKVYQHFGSFKSAIFYKWQLSSLEKLLWWKSKSV
ncbi:helix-turn-helix domain-containing protein [Clostridium estertheticum]|uniref:helix-turn-helix domain-containing protein n=2 Tax=Clostridium estertheticum TaxID=238834 RepID=UPI0028168E05|nr:helix-turn-helix domain-containing protein [Clostridium estertheticum]